MGRSGRGALVLVRLAMLGAVYGAAVRIADAAQRVARWAHRAMLRVEMQRQTGRADR